jgi:hypothetical protein
MTAQKVRVRVRRMELWRVLGMSRCTALHTHMIMVDKQRERIPNVPRCLGSATHENGGWLVLLAGLSIYLVGGGFSQGNGTSRCEQ